MALWITQIMLNFIFGGLGILILLGRRDQKRLEAEVRRLKLQLEAAPAATPKLATNSTSLMSTAGLSGPAVTMPSPSLPPTSNPRLIEKTATPANSSKLNVEAYEVAQQLLGRGLDVREVSRRTGLSVAELHLIGKVSYKNH